jgi:hypothetical protein
MHYNTFPVISTTLQAGQSRNSQTNAVPVVLVGRQLHGCGQHIV